MRRMKTQLASALVAVLVSAAAAQAQEAADLNDLEIAHVAYTADNIDIRYAHLALALSEDATVREFAETMIRDHTAVNERALALLDKLEAQPQDNFLSQALVAQSTENIAAMVKLTGSEFDRHYIENELEYHKAVNGLVVDTFIPNIDNAEVKELFQAAAAIFKAHEVHAENAVASLEK